MKQYNNILWLSIHRVHLQAHLLLNPYHLQNNLRRICHTHTWPFEGHYPPTYPVPRVIHPCTPPMTNQPPQTYHGEWGPPRLIYGHYWWQTTGLVSSNTKLGCNVEHASDGL